MAETDKHQWKAANSAPAVLPWQHFHLSEVRSGLRWWSRVEVETIAVEAAAAAAAAAAAVVVVVVAVVGHLSSSTV